MLTHLDALTCALGERGVRSWVAAPPGSLKRLRWRLQASGQAVGPCEPGGGRDGPAMGGPAPGPLGLSLPLGDGFRPWSDLQAVRVLRQLVAHWEPDVVHAHGHKAALTAAVALRAVPFRRRPALVVTVHNFLPARRRAALRRVERWAAARALAVADRVIAVSRILEEFVRELPIPCGANGRLRVIPNGLDPRRLPVEGPQGQEPFPEAPESGTFVVVCVARLTPLRGLPEVIEAAALAAREVEGLRVWVVGDGPLRSTLIGQAKRLGLSGRVHFTGHQADPLQLAALVGHAGAAVLPWLREGASYSALEAMAMGVPVIAFDCPGARELVPADAGILVPPQDVQALAAAMVCLAASPERRRRLALGARRAVAGRTAERMAQQTLAVYREVAPRL